MSKAGSPRGAAGLRRFRGSLRQAVVVLAALSAIVTGCAAPQALPTAGSGARSAQAAALLLDLATALESGEVDAVMDLAPPHDDRARSRLAVVAANAAAVGLSDVSATYVGEPVRARGDGSWTAVVALEWRYRGFDTTPGRAEVIAGFQPEGDGVALTGIAGDPDGGRVTPTWLRSGLTVARDDDVLVLVEGDHLDAQALALQVSAATEAMPYGFGDPGPIIVEVPGGGRGLDDALAARPGSHDGIAAAVTGTYRSAQVGGPQRILLNPDVVAGMGPHGLRTVLTHELVHLVTGAAGSAAEPWIVEGLADHVALGGEVIPDAVTLSHAVELVRREGLPAKLPGPGAFATTGPDLAAAYEMAWLACELVAETEGEAALRRLHARVVEGEATEAAMAASGIDHDRLVRRWRHRLRDLAG